MKYLLLILCLLSGCVCIGKQRYEAEKKYQYMIGYYDGASRALELKYENKEKKK